jgi:exodeoxyribonuclease VII large subunit
VTTRRRGTDAAEPAEVLDLFAPTAAAPTTTHSESKSPSRSQSRGARSSRSASTRGAIVESDVSLRPDAGSYDVSTMDHGVLPMVAEDEPIEHSIPGASPVSAVSVSTLTQTTKDVLEGAFVPLWIRGEITDFKAHRNGHWYFCLRDQSAQIKCVVWARDQRRMPAPPDDGMQVTALGQITVYAARGELQLTIKAIEAQGDGLWRKALEATRAKLAAEGLLDPSRKRALPRFPTRVAVVTSASGAALHDIISVARRRSPQVEIVLIPAKVQGDGAPEEIVAAIELAGRWGDADVLIVGRGGGGREDLWAFNDERVVRALANCPIPTISAVGHEVDVTLCDLVADLRAATPSAAAEAAVPEQSQMLRALRLAGESMHAALGYRIDRGRADVERLRVSMASVAARTTERRRARIEAIAGRLNALSPLATLARGYAVARDADGRVLASATAFVPGERFELTLRDGNVSAITQAVHPTDGASA